ncbi:MAG: cation diffusion facilitator family transporter [Acidimicrobiales bacterium]
MSRTWRLAVALAINVALVAGQVVAGVISHSAGLLADAGHNLTDVAAVGLSLVAVRWALRPRSANRSYGNHRGTILAALANAAVLAVVTVAIAAVGIVRLLHPTHVDGGVVAAVAGAAVVANGLAAWALHEGDRDLNMRSAVLHMVSDLAASAVVAAAGVAIVVAGGGGWERADPVASLVVAALVLVEAVRIAKESADVLLESTPPDVDLAALRRSMTATPGVGEVHDLHVWSLSSEYRALSAHLVLTGHPTLEEAQAVGNVVRAGVSDPFGIAHATFELECERCDDELDDPCAVDDAHVVPHQVAGA